MIESVPWDEFALSSMHTAPATDSEVVLWQDEPESVPVRFIVNRNDPSTASKWLNLGHTVRLRLLLKRSVPCGDIRPFVAPKGPKQDAGVQLDRAGIWRRQGGADYSQPCPESAKK